MFSRNPAPDEQRADLTASLSLGRAKLGEIGAAKKERALAAATGDDDAKQAFVELDEQAEAQRIEIETLILALEEIDRRQAEELNRQK